MLAMNFRGKLPVLRDDDYVVFESLAILYYLDQKYPRAADLRAQPGGGRRDHAGDLRVPGVRRAAAASQIVAALLEHHERKVDEDALAEAMHRVAGEARTIEQRLARSDWVVGESFSAADMMIYPDIRLLLRALQAARSARAGGALPADGDQLSGDRPLARARRCAARARAHLAAALALSGAARALPHAKVAAMADAGGRRGDCYASPLLSGTIMSQQTKSTSNFPAASCSSASAASVRACCR